MSETPVLTKKQQKSSLSGKKTKTRDTIRNVLATPFAKYWPLVSDEQAKSLHDTMSKTLPRIVPTKIYIPGRSIKNVPKLERKLFRKEFRESLKNNTSHEELGERTGLIFGVNDVTKAIEKGNIVNSVLITADVQPKLLVEHLIDQSVLYRIPVLIVPNLKDILKSICGFSSISMGLMNDDKYQVLQRLIEDIYKCYPVPRKHINFQRSLDLLNSTIIVLDDTVVEEGAVINHEESNEEKTKAVNDIYLYRDSTDRRVFIPNKRNNENKIEMQLDSSAFLSSSLNAKQTLDRNPKYTPLTVRKIKGNSNRGKRKIEEMKKRMEKKAKKRKH